jgi:regulator of sirC expression with transglutaminase-like and TPR domain
MGETPLLPLLRFLAYAARDDEALDLAEGALLVAEIAHPALDRARALRRLDALAAAVRAELGMDDGALLPADSLPLRTAAERVLTALRTVLAEREGFTGDQDDYYNPCNSFLSDVLDRRRGIPITLSVVYLEVARRLGAPLVGVGLPAHFLAKWPLPSEQGGDLFVDAFDGGVLLDLSACRRLALRLRVQGGDGAIFDPSWLDAVGTRALLTRMLHNLKQIYLQAGDTRTALEAVERLVALCPDLPEELRDRGLLLVALGEPLLGAADLALYAVRRPDAPELGRLRRRLWELRELRAKLN